MDVVGYHTVRTSFCLDKATRFAASTLGSQKIWYSRYQPLNHFVKKKVRRSWRAFFFGVSVGRPSVCSISVTLPGVLDVQVTSNESYSQALHPLVSSCQCPVLGVSSIRRWHVSVRARFAQFLGVRIIFISRKTKERNRFIRPDKHDVYNVTDLFTCIQSSSSSLSSSSSERDSDRPRSQRERKRLRPTYVWTCCRQSRTVAFGHFSYCRLAAGHVSRLDTLERSKNVLRLEVSWELYGHVYIGDALQTLFFRKVIKH